MAIATPGATPATRPKTRGQTVRSARKHLVSYIMISPFYVLYAVFGLIPLLFSLYLSFHEWNMLTPMQFRGLQNYVHLLFHDPLFRQAVGNNVYIALIAGSIEGAGALVLGFILNSRRLKFRHFFRSAYFMPILASSVAVGIIFNQLFGTQYGVVNAFLEMIGLPRVQWLTGSGKWTKAVIIILNLWRYTGWNMILVTAGLQAIPTELYECAEIDGASQVRVLTDITLPLLRPTILYILITMISGSIQMFDESFIVAGDMGGPNRQGMTLAMYMYANAFSYLKLGYASSLGYVMAVMIFGLSLITIKFYYRREA
jgi:ABC-type sugar transport system permease subunit